jgi:hypothetical protein
MDLNALIVQSAFFGALGGAVRGIIGLLKSTAEQTAVTGNVLQKAVGIFQWEYFGLSVTGSALAGVTLGLVSCYSFGVGVTACSVTTVGLIAAGYAGIDAVESILTNLPKPAAATPK